MKRTIALLFLAALPLLASEEEDVPAKTRAAIESLQVGAREDDVVALLKPLALDSGRITWGGTGNGRYYFRVSETRQFWVEISGQKGFVVSEIGVVEPFGIWTRDRLGGLSVQERKPKAEAGGKEKRGGPKAQGNG